MVTDVVFLSRSSGVHPLWNKNLRLLVDLYCAVGAFAKADSVIMEEFSQYRSRYKSNSLDPSDPGLAVKNIYDRDINHDDVLNIEKYLPWIKLHIGVLEQGNMDSIRLHRAQDFLAAAQEKLSRK